MQICERMLLKYICSREILPGGEKDRQVNHLEMIAPDCARAQHGLPAVRAQFTLSCIRLFTLYTILCTSGSMDDLQCMHKLVRCALDCTCTILCTWGSIDDLYCGHTLVCALDCTRTRMCTLYTRLCAHGAAWMTCSVCTM